MKTKDLTIDEALKLMIDGYYVTHPDHRTGFFFYYRNREFFEVVTLKGPFVVQQLARIPEWNEGYYVYEKLSQSTQYEEVFYAPIREKGDYKFIEQGVAYETLKMAMEHTSDTIGHAPVKIIRSKE